MYLTHPVPSGLRIIDRLPEPELPPQALAVAEEVWAQRKAANPALFNGKVFSLDRFEGADVLGFMAQYKCYLAQLDHPELADAYRISSLAVSGLVVARGHVLFGLRKTSLSVEPGLWEMVPSGTIHADLREADGSLSWAGIFKDEFAEELGMPFPDTPCTAFALVEDTTTRIWELGVAAELDLDHRDVLLAWSTAGQVEHAEMAAVPVEEAARCITERGPLMTGVSKHLLAAWTGAPRA